MSNANWNNHVHQINQMYGNNINSAGNHTHQVNNMNHSQCAVNCGSHGCSGALSGLIGSGYLGGVGSVYTGPLPSISGGVYTPPNPLTSEESKELEELKAQRLIETKNLKLQEFKKLPATLRQHVVDAIFWQRTVNAANTLEAPKSARQQELEDRQDPFTNLQNMFKISSGQQWGGLSQYMGGVVDTSASLQYHGTIRLPAGITEDEIIDAHHEATIEEQLLGSEDDEPTTVQTE